MSRFSQFFSHKGIVYILTKLRNLFEKIHHIQCSILFFPGGEMELLKFLNHMFDKTSDYATSEIRDVYIVHRILISFMKYLFFSLHFVVFFSTPTPALFFILMWFLVFIFIYAQISMLYVYRLFMLDFFLSRSFRIEETEITK